MMLLTCMIVVWKSQNLPSANWRLREACTVVRRIES